MAIVEVVKYNGPPDIFAWKYPSEELGTWTQLIVNESQEAILLKNGAALGLFPRGRYTLDTNNIPILKSIMKLPFGGRSPFTAEVWYVNKRFKLDIKWGTASPIQLQDPKYGVFVPIRANGIFGIQIKDSMTFLHKLVGTAPGFDEQSMIRYFRGLFITKVKDAIATYIVKKSISVLEINAYIDELSSYMKTQIEPEMEAYGISLTSFYVNEISMPEDDPAVHKLKAALAKRAEMDIVGYQYQEERMFDTMETAARNVPFDAAVFTETECPRCHANVMQGQRFCGSCGYDMQKPINAEEPGNGTIRCAKCGTVIKNEKFCPECGRRIKQPAQSGANSRKAMQSILNFGMGFLKNSGSQKAPPSKELQPPTESSSKQCPKCGRTVDNAAKFCPDCGKQIK